MWVRVLSTYSEQLRPLVYPLSQVIEGVSHLVPTARYFPLRLHCVQMLNRLAAATHTFIPVASLLLDMLQFKDLHMNPTGGVGKALDFSTVVKVQVFFCIFLLKSMSRLLSQYCMDTWKHNQLNSLKRI